MAYGDISLNRLTWNGTLYVATALTAPYEWEFDYTLGTSGPYDTPQPGTGTLSTVYESTESAYGELEIGDICRIGVTAGAGGISLFTGIVQEISTEMFAYGTVKDLVRTSIQLAGTSSVLLNQTWYNADASSMSAQAQLNRIIAAVNTQSWYEVDGTMTWQQAPAGRKWNTWDTSIQELAGSVTVNGIGTWAMSIPIGIRSVWEDITTILAGSHGAMIENPSGSIVLTAGTGTPSYASWSANNAEPSLRAVASKTDIRNTVDVTYNGGTYTTSKAGSVNAYGAQTGGVTTYLNNVNDAATIAGYIVGAYSSPNIYLQNITFDYLNPALASQWTETNAFSAVTVSNIPAAISATTSQNHYITGYSASVSKYAYRYTYNLFPTALWNSSVTWQTIGQGYTWTSYGTAFPTTKWSDL